MPLFGRKKQPVEEDQKDWTPFVVTESGWRPLQDVINERWHSLAGFAWVQYQEYGHGAVMADSAFEELRYVIADALRGDADLRREPLWQEVLALCQSYTPRKEVVLVTTVTRVRGDDRRLSDLVEILKPPRGEMSPPEAAAYMQRFEKQHQLYTAMRARIGNLDAEDDERQEKGLDPDAV